MKIGACMALTQTMMCKINKNNKKQPPNKHFPIVAIALKCIKMHQ